MLDGIMEVSLWDQKNEKPERNFDDNVR
jgi:hypothetical protein